MHFFPFTFYGGSSGIEWWFFEVTKKPIWVHTFHQWHVNILPYFVWLKRWGRVNFNTAFAMPGQNVKVGKEGWWEENHPTMCSWVQFQAVSEEPEAPLEVANPLPTRQWILPLNWPSLNFSPLCQRKFAITFMPSSLSGKRGEGGHTILHFQNLFLVSEHGKF